MNGNPLNVIKESDLSLFEQIGNAHELALKDGEISKKNKLLIASTAFGLRSGLTKFL